MRNWLLPGAILICLQLMLQTCDCLSVSLRGSSSYAKLGHRFKFTCKVSYDDDRTVGTVTFSRSWNNVASFPTSCSGGRSDFGYSYSCGRSGVHTLVINSVREQDDATWKCTARSRSSSVQLSVYYGPERITLDKSSPQKVKEHSRLTVRCTTSCNPCKYTWNKGLLTSSSSGTLNLYNIKSSQAGDYICTATNTKTGDTSRSSLLRVIVQTPPKVTLYTSPGSCRPYRVYVGQWNVKLTCQVTSANPKVTSYIWTRNGISVQSSSSNVYSLSPVGRSSGGRYTCAGRNSAGTSSYPPSVQVDVLYSPEVSVPSSVTVIEEKTLSVHCSVSSNPPATVTWTWKDGGSFTAQSRSTLTIFNIQKSQEGTYVCTATNTLNPCSGGSRRETVTKEVTVEVKYKRIYVVTEYRFLEINCTKYITQVIPDTANFTWTGPGTFTATGPILYIANITRNYTGEYYCILSNSQSQTVLATEKFRAIINYPAVITSFTINSKTNEVAVSESDHVIMRCQVDSNPGSTIKLYNGSTELSRVDNSLTNEHSWTATCRQRGGYTCTAHNGIGTASSVTRQIEFVVMCSPRHDTSNGVRVRFASLLGHNISLSVPLLSYPEPNIVWRNSNIGKHLTSMSSVSRVSDVSVVASLTLTNVMEEDFGDYLVQADNGVEPSVEYTVKLLRAGPPNTPTNLTVVSQTSSSVKVMWKQGYNRESFQTFTIEYSTDDLSWEAYGAHNETGEGLYLQMDITGLSPQTVYYVRVAASNEHGITYTHSVRALTEKEDEVAPAGLIVGVTVGVLLLVAFVIIVVFLVRRFKRVLPRPGCCSVNPVIQGSKENGKNVPPQGKDRQLPNLYDGLHRKDLDTATYTELNTYRNLSFIGDSGNVYDEIRSTSSESNYYAEIQQLDYEDRKRVTREQSHPSTTIFPVEIERTVPSYV